MRVVTGQQGVGYTGVREVKREDRESYLRLRTILSNFGQMPAEPLLESKYPASSMHSETVPPMAPVIAMARVPVA